MFNIGKNKKSIKNLKRFKSAKFNYAKFVKDYYIENETAYISAKVNSIDDIISKYSTKDYEWINPEFAHYLEECAYYIPVEESITIEICDGHFTKKEQELIRKVIKDYFGLKLGDKFLDLQLNKHRSMVLLTFGIVSLLLFTILSKLAIITTTLNELMLLLLWYFLWEFADMALINGSELHSQRIEAGQLSTARITFLDTDTSIKEEHNNTTKNTV